MTIGLSQQTTTPTQQPVTTTTDETTLDNSSTLASEEPSNGDNSINTAMEGEPENVADEAVNTDNKKEGDGQGDDGVIEIPEKFKDKDGNVDLKKLANAYKELEPIVNEKASLKQEFDQQADRLKAFEQKQNELAQSFGFKTYEDLQTYQNEVQRNTQLAEMEAKAYSDYLNLCDLEDRETARQLLIEYSQHPTQELLQEIENIFPASANKKVGEIMATQKAEFQRQNAQFAYEQEVQKAETYLKDVTEKHKDMFENKDFVNLFGLAFKELGAGLDCDVFVNSIRAIEQSAINRYITQQGQQQENNDAIKTLEGLSPTTKQTKSAPINVDLNKINDKDLSNLVSKLI